MFMNNFDTSNWKTFAIKELFTWDKGKYLSSADKNDYKGSIPCINGSSLNNGLLTFLDRSIEEKHFKLQKAPCLSLSRVGNAGLTFVQPRDFYIADNAYALKLKNITDNVYVYLFISTVLNLETKKYSYGRIINSKYFDTKIKLPADADGQPDWSFMENFIKNKYIQTEKRITTKIKRKELPFDTKLWKNFNIADYFEIRAGKYHYPVEYQKGKTPYISATAENNGVGEYIDLNPEFSGNVITTEKVKCSAFYQHDDFCATSDVNILTPKGFKLNKYIGMFLSTVINFNEKFRWNYGKQCRIQNMKKMSIKLPADKNGNPDWDYMEKYIKSLPYSDLI